MTYLWDVTWVWLWTATEACTSTSMELTKALCALTYLTPATSCLTCVDIARRYCVACVLWNKYYITHFLLLFVLLFVPLLFILPLFFPLLFVLPLFVPLLYSPSLCSPPLCSPPLSPPPTPLKCRDGVDLLLLTSDGHLYWGPTAIKPSLCCVWTTPE